MSDRKRVQADLNGLFGDLLCLPHEDFRRDGTGAIVSLKSGMAVTAFDEDVDRAGTWDDIIAMGIVEASPDWLRCKGSRWVLRIDAHGECHESDLLGRSNP